MPNRVENLLRAASFGLGDGKLAAVQASDLRPLNADLMRPASPATNLIDRMLTFRSHAQFEGLVKKPDRYPRNMPSLAVYGLSALRAILRDSNKSAQAIPAESREIDGRLFTLRPLVLIPGLAAILAVFWALLDSRAMTVFVPAIFLFLGGVLFELLVVRIKLIRSASPLPLFLTGVNLGITERSSLRYTVTHDGKVTISPKLTTGFVTLSGTLTLEDDRARMAIYRARYGKTPEVASGGFLAFNGDPRLRWASNVNVSKHSPAVLAITDLFSEDSVRAAVESNDNVKVLNVKRKWDFEVLESSDNVGSNISISASLVPEQSARLFRIIIRSNLVDKAVASEVYRLQKIEVLFPNYFPPIEQVAADAIDPLGRYSKQQVNLAKFVDQSRFDASIAGEDHLLEPGAQIVIYVRFDYDIPLDELGDDAMLRARIRLAHGAASPKGDRTPRCGLGRFQSFDPYGYLEGRDFRRFSQYELETMIELDLGLRNLSYVSPDTKRAEVPCPVGFTPESAFIADLVNELASIDLHVRQVREDRLSDMALGSGDTLYWDILARDNSSMFSPDVQLVVTSTRRGDALPIAKIEISVLGRVRKRVDAGLKTDLATLDDLLAKLLAVVSALVTSQPIPEHSSEDTNSSPESYRKNADNGEISELMMRVEIAISKLESIVGRLDTP